MKASTKNGWVNAKRYKINPSIKAKNDMLSTKIKSYIDDLKESECQKHSESIHTELEKYSNVELLAVYLNGDKTAGPLVIKELAYRHEKMDAFFTKIRTLR